MKSKKILQSAKNKECTLRLAGICNFDNATTVAHHLNFNSVKDDIATIRICSSCHSAIHANKYSYGNDVARAYVETIKQYYDEGLIIDGI